MATHVLVRAMEGAANATTTTTAAGPPKRQVVLYPTPGMGHLFAMVELGRAIAARGLAVTIVVVDPPYDTGAPGPFFAGVSAANPSISFHRVPKADDLPPVASKHYEALIVEAVRAANPHLRALLAAAARPTRPAALVVDMFSGAALDVAGELGVPAYFFFTSGAACLAFFLHLPALHARTAASFRDMGEQLVRVPGVPPFPATHAIHATMDRGDAAYGAFMDAAAALCRCRGVIVNTFRSLEPRAVDAVVAGRCAPPGQPTPPVHCVGPLIKSLEFAEGGGECLPWLDKQPKASVVFLCFGSLGRFSAEQTRELAAGLEASGQRFLWVVRAPPGGDSEDDPARKFQKPPEPDLGALLPDGFLRRTRARGLVVKSWAPQRDVLAHGSVGGFVTHCGWNSVLEAVMAGVPMLGLPLHAEQRMNLRLLEKELRLAVALEGYDGGIVAAEEVATKVRWLMDSGGGTALRERTLAAMAQGKEALRQGGESEAALAGLVDLWMTS
ncbi:UDP-glycosyltransferase 88A1-like [Panicum virgatum]|nr:UDP-glycosyltransferase 88A1-like [Panicum virgatum]